MIDTHVQHKYFPRAPRGYFDTAAVGTVPTRVSLAVRSVGEALEQGTRGSAAWHEATDPALDLLAADFGTTADRLSVLANTGTAIASIAHAIPFTAGDEILTVADDFPNVRLGWTTTTATIREVEISDEARRTEDILGALTPGVRVVAVTHVHATTGTTIDLERLYEACKTNGTLLVVDGAQAAGIATVPQESFDVYVGASYKWLLAGFGGAVVATGPRFQDVARPLLIGYMNMGSATDLTVGHDPLYVRAALAAAAEVRNEIGRDAIRVHTRHLVRRIMDEARPLGFRAVTHQPAGIVSLRANDVSELATALRARGLSTAVRGDYLRLSPYLASTNDDVDLLLNALEDLAPEHARLE